MPRVCTVCSHPDQQAIDSALVAGEPYRRIAARTDTSTGALQRHRADHLPVALTKAAEAGAIADADALIDQLRNLQQRTLRLLDQAEEAGKLSVALMAIGQARQNLELLAKLLGELAQEGAVSVLIQPQWLQVRAGLLEALQPHPEARTAIVARLATLEATYEPRG